MCGCQAHQKIGDQLCTCVCPEHDSMPKDWDAFRSWIKALNQPCDRPHWRHLDESEDDAW